MERQFVVRENVSYEDRLGDAFEKLLQDGADDCATLAAGLNDLKIEHPDGEAWTAERLEAELERLGR